MGFLDDISATFNRGADAAGRTARTIKLKGQIADVNRRRHSLAAQLGALLYERCKDDPAMREGCEELFAGITACDEERAGYQAEVDAIEEEAAAATEAARTLECPNCHTRVSLGDRFCSGCGTPIDEIKAAAEARAEEEAAGPAMCPQCGAPVGDDDLFCTACGARVDDVPEAVIVQVESVERIEKPAAGDEGVPGGSDAESDHADADAEASAEPRA